MLLQAFIDELEKISAVATKTDPAKWEQAKRDAKAKMGGKHSARAMQLATQLYKKRGGGYSGSKPTAKNNSLKRWGKQKWRWSGEKTAGKGVYLPSAKIDRLKSTPEGRKRLAAAARKKAKATREGEQYSSHGLAAGTSLTKKATVKRHVKEYRRALEAFERHRRGLPGSKDWHAARGKGLSNILAAGEIRPGKVNKASPVTVSGKALEEVYFGRGHPASPWYMPGTKSRAVGVNHERLMGLDMPQTKTLTEFLSDYESHPEVQKYFARLFSKPRLAESSGGISSVTNPAKWVQAPGRVSLKSKDIVVAPKGSLTEKEKLLIRKNRLRYIPTETLDAAAKRISTYKVPRDLPIDVDQLKRQS